jgi:hypothetical protein
MEPMDIRGYKFEDEAQAEEARKAIIVRIGPIVEREENELTITAPQESASDAAKICETMGGKATNSFLF